LAAAGPVPFADEQILECTMQGSTHCVLENVQITRETSRLEINAPDPGLIRSVVFLNSHVEVLSRDICDHFENLELLDIERSSLHEIDVDAFENCANLQSLVLTSNQLEKLDANLFDSLANLRYLYLDGNHLRSIGENQFVGTPELLFLYLQDNQISQFPAEALKPLSKLMALSFHTNELSDFDAAGIIATVPNLFFIEFNNNPLSCTRLGNILEAFRNARVQIFDDVEKRDRFYQTIDLSGIQCLEDVEWTGAYYRRLNILPGADPEIQQLTDEVKTLELEIVELEKLLTKGN